MSNEQIRQNSVNFGPKCSPEIENVPQTAFAAFRDSVGDWCNAKLIAILSGECEHVRRLRKYYGNVLEYVREARKYTRDGLKLHAMG